jgi:ABC-type multidrug transport system fused ATPase/permease subunit
LRYFGSPLFLVLLVVVTLLDGGLSVSTSYWLATWVDAYGDNQYVDVVFYAGVYAGLSALSTTMEGAEILTFNRGAWVAARRLHKELLHGVLNAPISWWKDMPVGRVVNRFARDVKSL